MPTLPGPPPTADIANQPQDLFNRWHRYNLTALLKTEVHKATANMKEALPAWENQGVRYLSPHLKPQPPIIQAEEALTLHSLLPSEQAASKEGSQKPYIIINNAENSRDYTEINWQ